jgi:hypothetical protein
MGLSKIELQQKTKPKKGKIETYFFDNKSIGLSKTLFHRFYIPLESFNSGLDYEPQPVETEIVFEWIKLNLVEPRDLDNIELTSSQDSELEVSIYVGNAHNRCYIKHMTFKKIEDNLYETKCELFVDFETEGVAQNERFDFSTIMELNEQDQ